MPMPFEKRNGNGPAGRLRARADAAGEINHGDEGEHNNECHGPTLPPSRVEPLIDK